MSELASPASRGVAKSAASTVSQAASGPGGRKGAAPSPEFEFNLGNTKAKVLKGFDEKVPGQVRRLLLTAFRRFYTSPLFDRMLQTFLLYFTALFQLEWVISAMERSRKQHLEGYNPYAVASRIRELEDEVQALKVELSPLYSQLILSHSTYEKPQQDRKFFEALYDALIAILDDAFDRLKKRPDIEREVGSLFRSKHFNLYKRRNQPPRSVDTLSVKELYALKHETSNRALNARTLASLFDKPPSIPVTVAAVTNSPLVTQYIMSPIVARSMMKDPEQRDQVLGGGRSKSSSPSRPGSDHAGHRRDLGNIFRSTAMLKGIDPTRLASELSTMKMKPSDAAELGLVGAERARRGEGNRPPAGYVAPEAAGLPVDDSYNYLALMKRYILYGPSLGLNNPAAPQPGGSLSQTVPPTPSMQATLQGSITNLRHTIGSEGGVR